MLHIFRSLHNFFVFVFFFITQVFWTKQFWDKVVHKSLLINKYLTKKIHCQLNLWIQQGLVINLV